MSLHTNPASRIAKAVLTLLLPATLATLAAFTPAGANADSCPNAADRFGPSANLPDCRAYELVTPAVKGDNSFMINMYPFPDGDHVTFGTLLPLPGSKNANPNVGLSSRGPSGWLTTSLTSPQGPGELESLYNGETFNDVYSVSFASDFSAAFVSTSYASDTLDQNPFSDVYRIESPSGSSSLVSLPDTGASTSELYTPPGVSVAGAPGAYVSGSAADGSRVFFSTMGRLPTAPGTPADTHLAGYETYERYAGHTYLVGVLPDGSPAPCGAEIGEGGSTGSQHEPFLRYGAVSPDGSDVVFHTPSDPAPECEESEALYLRENNGTSAAKTIQLPGLFYLGRAGSRILTTGGPGGNSEGEPIYEYDTTTGQVTTVGYGGLLAYSADGSRVYYLTHLGEGYAQQLEVYDRGVAKTVPNAGPGYGGRYYQSTKPVQTAFTEDYPVTTPDGSKLLFLDGSNLTSYDSRGPGCAALNANYTLELGVAGEHCDEAYVYDLETGSVTCVSCNPSGTPPVADTQLLSHPAGLDSFLPPTSSLISENGSRAFFETSEALVPQDTNGTDDVYEWENGHVDLISSGLGGTLGKEETNNGIFSGVSGAELVGASSNGDDVFFASTESLSPQDEESTEQIYDARVDGGFPYATPEYGCDSGQCQGPQTPAPSFAPPASATFVGVGNPARVEAGAPVRAKPATKKARHTKSATKKARHKHTRVTGSRRNGIRHGKGRSR